MADRTGYILIDRNILDWKWWKNHETLVLFLTLLLKANYKDNDFEGQTIHRGQLVTSIPTLCQQANLTTQKVRTSLDRLISTGEITNKSTNKYRIITIVNYDKYQELTGKLTDEQQTTNRQLTDKLTASKYIYNTRNTRNAKKEKGRSAPKSPSGFSDKSYAETMPDMDKGTVDDIPAEYRDQFDNYADYWRFRNR